MRDKVEELTLAHFKYFPEILGFKTNKLQSLEIINCGLGSSMFNIAFGRTDLEIQNIINNFNSQAFAWWIPPSAQSPSITKSLKQSGFIIEADEEIMLCELESVEINYQENNLQIQQALTKENLKDFISVISPYDKTAEQFYHKLDTSDLNKKEKLFIGYYESTPAVIALLFSDHNMSGIFSLITKEEYRGKGLGSQMMRYLMNFAKENGSQYAFLSSSSNSGYKIYQILGFKVIGNFECFEYKIKNHL